MTHLQKIAAIGECMIELTHQDLQTLKMDFSGDTLNTALYLARYQQAYNLSVSYVTVLGDDPYSAMMINQWQEEGIDCSFVQTLSAKLPGLYLIRTDQCGERHFYYYRTQSAAKQLFYTEKMTEICEKLIHFQYLYFSGITLAILDSYSRDALLKLMRRARENGAIICFDPNYRASLWNSVGDAQNIISQAIACANIVLPTFSDEQILFHDKNPEMTIERLRDFGVEEIIVKNGKEGAWVSFDHEIHYLTAAPVEKVVDTTGAGDSFNAAYLASRAQGLNPIKAARCGHKLASRVIQYKGAIIPLNAMRE